MDGQASGLAPVRNVRGLTAHRLADARQDVDAGAVLHLAVADHLGHPSRCPVQDAVTLALFGVEYRCNDAPQAPVGEAFIPRRR